MDRKTLRVGITAILCAGVFRLFSPGIPRAVGNFLTRPDVTAFLLYLETGRDVRFSASRGQEAYYVDLGNPGLEYPEESPPPRLPPPVFTEADCPELYYACSLRPDVTALLQQPLRWELASGAPTVLILHTHTTESYTRGDLPYEETAAYRTLDERYNMLSLGDRVAEILTASGIVTLHDRSFHDYPSYNGSYGRSRDTALQYIKEYPSLLLILDLHRDAVDMGWGQLRTLCSVNGRESAQLMLVMGTDEGGLTHPRWEENLSIALKLHAQLERQCPGIMRPLCLRRQRFNQDLAPGALLIEIGAAGNSHAEAIPAAEQLALAIGALAKGANPTENAAARETGNLPAPEAVP